MYIYNFLVIFLGFWYIFGLLGIFPDFWVYFHIFGYISGFWGIFLCFVVNYCVLMENHADGAIDPWSCSLWWSTQFVFLKENYKISTYQFYFFLQKEGQFLVFFGKEYSKIILLELEHLFLKLIEYGTVSDCIWNLVYS